MDAKLESYNRTRVNRELSVMCSQYYDSLPLLNLDECLKTHGFNGLEEGIYCGRDGRVHEQIGNRTWILFTWHKLEITGQYEIVAYVS